MAVVTGARADAGDGARRAAMLAARGGARASANVAVISQAAGEPVLWRRRRARSAVTSRVQSESDRVIDARVVGVSTDVANTDRTSTPPAARVDADAAGDAPYHVHASKAGSRGARRPASARRRGVDGAGGADRKPAKRSTRRCSSAASSDYVIIGALGGFAMLALLLASAGLFGVVSYRCAQRTAEFGTRMALGASAGDVVRLVARQSLSMLAIGVAIGLAGRRRHRLHDVRVLYGMSPPIRSTLGWRDRAARCRHDRSRPRFPRGARRASIR